MSITEVTQREVDLILRSYNQQELARKYILATNDCMDAEHEVSRLKHEVSRLMTELSQYKKLAPIGCPQCHRGCFSNDKYCPHCGAKLEKEAKG